MFSLMHPIRLLNVLDIMESVARNTRLKLIGEDIKTNFIKGHRLGTVHADPGQMEQVLMNLCVNSRDAMPQGGYLTIETENVLITEEYTKTHLFARKGRYVLVTLSDNGCGMNEETRNRIFEPFFTTKDVDRGTGLGLASVFGIINQHHGYINVYLFLPRCTR